MQIWQNILGDGLPDGVSMLLAEYQKHLLSRARFYFPAELPPDALAEEPKESPIHPRLAMPLEGVGPAKDKVGTVGQAVYAGAAAFVLVTRCWHRPSGAPFTLFCNYPIAQLESDGDRRHGSIKLHLTGSPLLTCLIRLIPTPRNKAVFHISSSAGRARWHAKGPDGWSANVPGGSRWRSLGSTLRRMSIRIGISGWNYPPWRGGRFYPKGWPQKRELEYASRQVSSIEINGSFYSLQRPESYRAWYDATPEGFVFSIKGSRFITHMKRLKDVETPLANFFASGVLLLREKLGPFLWQFPPNFRFDLERLRKFFELLPRDMRAGARLAKEHDERLRGRVWTKTDCARPLRHAIEIRHSSFETAEFIALLRAHDIAMVVADTAGKWPLIEDATSDFVYLRLHGDEELYVSGYTPEALGMWERKVRAWVKGSTPTGARLLAERQVARDQDVFVYFDNDAKVHAPFDAMSLAHQLRLGAAPTGAPDFSKIKEGGEAGATALTQMPVLTTA